MTDAERLGCDDPEQMLRYVTSPGALAARPRKLWLFAAACGRHNPAKLACAPYRRLLEVIEDYADGQTRVSLLKDALDQAGYAPELLNDSQLGYSSDRFAFGEAQDIVTARGGSRLLGRILLDLIGPQLLSALSRVGSVSFAQTTQSLAQGAYENRLPTGYLDVTRLGILADALEDAGCADAGLLGHLRSPGPHVRGCWALDLVLGKQ